MFVSCCDKSKKDRRFILSLTALITDTYNSYIYQYGHAIEINNSQMLYIIAHSFKIGDLSYDYHHITLGQEEAQKRNALVDVETRYTVAGLEHWEKHFAANPSGATQAYPAY